MNPEVLRERISVDELLFSTSRSGGPGGQNVNKVNTKVELRFRIMDSPGLSMNEKEKILALLKNKINSEGELIIISQSDRSQLKNRKNAEEKFFKIVAAALTEKKARRATHPTLTSKIERLEVKKHRGTIKKLRKNSGSSEDE